MNRKELKKYNNKIVKLYLRKSVNGKETTEYFGDGYLKVGFRRSIVYIKNQLRVTSAVVCLNKNIERIMLKEGE
ncbi:MAG: hypothetical protein QXL94_08230 [Candidatus Parvarchaeum sp.]